MIGESMLLCSFIADLLTYCPGSKIEPRTFGLKHNNNVFARDYSIMLRK